MILAVVLASLTTVSLAFAGSPDGQHPGSGPGRVHGEVTAIGTDSLTVLTPDSTSVTVKTSSSTKVEILATGAAGSLSDIVVGSQVEVRGPRNEDGSITAEVITLLPAGDQLRGRVTAIENEAITVQAPGGTSATIVTTSDTTFRKGQDDASLSDVEVGQDVRAYGTLQSDGSLTAMLVLIQAGPGGGRRGPGIGAGTPGGEPGGPLGGPNGPAGSAGGRR
jgi:hypothetical protein